MGIIGSVGGLLGIGPGNQPAAAPTNSGTLSYDDYLNGMNGYSNHNIDLQHSYEDGSMTPDQIEAQAISEGMSPAGVNGLMDQLATGSQTGSKFAADQLNSNSTESGLYGSSGLLGNTENLINQEQNQGFELKPEDMTLYGQTSGNIARMFGQQEQGASQAMADRGLAAGPSGASAATFSGLQGNKMEMLAQAQQQIMQQRFANTQAQIHANQTLATNLGGQYNSALQNQFGRQLSGSQNMQNAMSNASSAQSSLNNQTFANNEYNTANQSQNVVGLASGILAGKGLLGFNSNPNAPQTTTNPNAQTSSQPTPAPSVTSDAGAASDAAFSHGGVVPGHAMFSGDNPANDTVDAKLSPGEVVIPRSEVPKLKSLFGKSS